MPRQTKPLPRPVARALGTVGEHFSTWRRLQRLTAEQVADRAGVSRGTVRRLEAGEGVSLESTFRVARALGVLEQLVTSLDPYTTDVGRLRADEELPRRVRPARQRSDG
jgi:transcriptional regulator with XRE-family HTH domain